MIIKQKLEAASHLASTRCTEPLDAKPHVRDVRPELVVALPRAVQTDKSSQPCPA